MNNYCMCGDVCTPYPGSFEQSRDEPLGEANGPCLGNIRVNERLLIW